MPRIEQIIADDPRLPPLERQVLDVMEKHPEYLFRKNKKADLQELRAWLLAPHTPEPPLSLVDSKVQPISILEHTIVSLHYKKIIGCVSINDYLDAMRMARHQRIPASPGRGACREIAGAFPGKPKQTFPLQ